MNYKGKNILTVDFEDLFTTGVLSWDNSPNGEEQRLDRETEILLNLLSKYDTKATFFIVAKHAEKYPEFIKRIIQKGHHIATHSYNHDLIYRISNTEFETDLKKSIRILEDLSNTEVDTYRAPAWSVKNGETDFFWDTLSNNGIKYSSSIFPTKNFLYGDPHAPRFINIRNNDIVEIPPSTIKYFKKNIPFSGGFYMRFLPYWFIDRAIRKINKMGHPVMVYIHPWEIDHEIDRVKSSSAKTNFIMNYNLNNHYKKFEKLLCDFEFCSIKEYFQ